ncbi:erythromycin esterase family protein [Nonomuraea sp. NPDC000554]|uniref:erythromycin esterase family protein n=1 Tax=Nonomuraea sp. NPDC000554 TaxID=3154259 RepID=UPI00332BEF45
MTSSVHDAGWAFADDSGVGAALKGFLQSLTARPRLLGLGEAMHGEEALPRLRNQVFQQLVEHEGYRSIAIESDCVAGLTVDAFVADGAGSLDEVMQCGFSHGFGESAANRELVSWMREYNTGRPVADRLRFFGFDAPLEMMSAASPRSALTALRGYLAAHVDAGLIPCGDDVIDRLIGDDDRWTNTDAAMNPSRSVGSSPDVTKLRLIADDLQALLVAEAPRLIAATSRDDWWRACMYGRTAAGLLRYHAGMADTSAKRVPRLMGLRDAMMADNLKAVVESQARRGPTLVFAHNRHLQRDPSRWQLADQLLEWWSAGAIVASQLGDQYAFVASALGGAPHQGLDVPRPDTLEGVLSTLPENRHLLNSRRLAAALADLGTELTLRTDNSTNYSYFALDPDHLQESDGVIFVKHLA